MLLSKCAVYDSKKSKFIKEAEGRGLLGSLGIKATLIKFTLVGPLLLSEYKMDKIVNKFLIAGDKYMPEMAGLVEHLQKAKKIQKS